MFTQSCFIRKNTKELRDFLDDIKLQIHPNYREYLLKFPNRKENFLFVNREAYCNSIFGYNEEVDRAIDCGENEELFKAVAAIRDDSDYMQYFITEVDRHWVNQGLYSPKGSLELCLVEDYWVGLKGIEKSTQGRIYPAHKATPEELIKHFSKYE